MQRRLGNARVSVSGVGGKVVINWYSSTFSPTGFEVVPDLYGSVGLGGGV